jgi:hypothetical protein
MKIKKAGQINKIFDYFLFDNNKGKNTRDIFFVILIDYFTQTNIISYYIIYRVLSIIDIQK